MIWIASCRLWAKDESESWMIAITEDCVAFACATESVIALESYESLQEIDSVVFFGSIHRLSSVVHVLITVVMYFMAAGIA